MPPALLVLENISKAFDGNAVLKGIDLEIASGDIVGLIGENGAGKSTCMNIIAGSLVWDSGRMVLSGKTIDQTSPADQLARGIRMIRQELSLAPALSVAENIFLGDYRTSRSGFVQYKRLNDAAAAVLSRIRADHISPESEVGTLRSGDQQLVEIAKALTTEPQLVIMDEPTSSLTQHEAENLLTLVRELAEAGTAIILITHRLEEILRVSHRIVVLRDGNKVAEHIPPVTREQLLQSMIGRATDERLGPRTLKKQGIASGTVSLAKPAVLQAEAVSDGRLHDVTFEVREGEIVGLYGLVGAGRTELLEMIYGLRKRLSGTLDVPAIEEIRMVSESRKTSGIFPSHDVRRNISISALPRLSRFGFVSAQEEMLMTEDLKMMFGIRAHSLTLPITSLSGGNQQKALLSRAFAASPRLLLLDEPTHGVDVGAKAEIYVLMREMAASGIALLVASSEIPELMKIADRCLVMSRQRLVSILERAEMSEKRLLAAAFAGH